MITEHLFGRMNTDDSPSDLPNGEIAYSLNTVTDNNDLSGSPRRKPVKSFLPVAMSLPTGMNITIGTCSDEPNRKMYFFNWNINGSHHICEYDQATKSAVILLTWSGLDFKRDYPIKGKGVLANRYLFFEDGLHQPRFIDILRCKNDPEYVSKICERAISYYRPQPIHPGYATRGNDPSREVNFVDDYSFQFAYRWKYKNGYFSLISPASELYNGYLVPERQGGSNYSTFNRYIVYAQIPYDIQHEIELVELLFRKGNIGEWNVIKEVPLTGESIQYDFPLQYQGNIVRANVVSYVFYNDTSYRLIDNATASKMVENIPRISDTLAVMNSRIWLNEKLVDRDLSDVDITITATVRRETTAEQAQFNEEGNMEVQPSLKSGGKYALGMICYDELGRPMPVLGKTSIEVPRETYLEVVDNSSSDIYQWDFEGLPIKRYVADLSYNVSLPSWVSGVQLARTKELYYLTYYQSKANLFFYVANYTQGTDIRDAEWLWRERLFLRGWPGYNEFNNDFSYLCVQVANNVPFVADTNCYIRFMSKFPGDALAGKELPIIEVDGDLIFVSTAGISWDRYNTLPATPFFASVMVEVYKRNDEIDEIFYETGLFYNILDSAEFEIEEISEGSTPMTSLWVKVLGDLTDIYHDGDTVILSTDVYIGEFTASSVVYFPDFSYTRFIVETPFGGDSNGTIGKDLVGKRILDTRFKAPFRGDAWFIRTNEEQAKQRFTSEGPVTPYYGISLWEDFQGVSEGVVARIESPSPQFAIVGASADVYDVNADDRNKENITTAQRNYEAKQQAKSTASAIGGALISTGGYVITANVYAGAVLIAAGVVLSIIGGSFAKKRRPKYIPRFLERASGFVLDYLNNASSIGRPNVEYPEFDEEDRANTVRFSNPYLADTKENNIHNIDALDEYPLDINRGGITSLVQVDDVLLAFHKSLVTTMYIQQAFIRANQADSFLVKTEGLIGDDRILASSRYGLVDPTAITVMQGRAYFFDRWNKELVQYSNDGVNPISTMYRVKKWMVDRVREFEGYENVAKIVMGYLPELEILYLTFNQADLYSSIEREARFKGVFEPTQEFISSLQAGDVVIRGGKYQVYNPPQE